MFTCYVLQYLDKTLINYANVMGLQEDTKTSKTQFTYLALAFYVSYCVCEIPQGYLMQKFRQRSRSAQNSVIQLVS